MEKRFSLVKKFLFKSQWPILEGFEFLQLIIICSFHRKNAPYIYVTLDIFFRSTRSILVFTSLLTTLLKITWLIASILCQVLKQFEAYVEKPGKNKRREWIWLHICLLIDIL